jgi:hypothetical protein
MMQAAQMRLGNDAAVRLRLDFARNRGVAVQGLMAASVMIIGKKSLEYAVQVALAENDHVINALAPNRADQSLDERALPRRPRRDEHFLNSHSLEPVPLPEISAAI